MKSFFACNMRGFNMSRKNQTVHHWIMKEKPLFGCLLETRARQENHSKYMKAVASPILNRIVGTAMVRGNVEHKATVPWSRKKVKDIRKT